LTAILRIADAIDYTRQCDIEVASLEELKNGYLLEISGKNTSYIKIRIDKKKPLFEEHFGPLKVLDSR
jgi:hypothetical protein